MRVSKLNNGNRSELRKTDARGTSLLLLALSLWLGGCAGVSVKGDWQDGAPHQSFSRVLIVGVSPDRNLRCAFESTLASQVQSAKTTALASCDYMNAKEPLTRENLERVVASAHADAVLATRLTSASTGHGEGTSSDMRGDSQYKAIDYGYGVYGMPVTYAAFQTQEPLKSLTSSLHVVTKVWATSNAALIYTIDTTTKSREIDSTQATLSAIAGPTADRLRREKLIR